MDYGGYFAIGVLLLAGLFFFIALLRLKSGQVQVLKFTSYGLATLSILGLIILISTDILDLKVSVSVFLILGVIYYWFYRGTLKDKNKDRD